MYQKQVDTALQSELQTVMKQAEEADEVQAIRNSQKFTAAPIKKYKPLPVVCAPQLTVPIEPQFETSKRAYQHFSQL